MRIEEQHGKAAAGCAWVFLEELVPLLSRGRGWGRSSYTAGGGSGAVGQTSVKVEVGQQT